MVPKSSTLFELCRRQGYVVAIVLLIVLLAGANWVLSPNHALRWLRTMLVLPALWLGLTLWHMRIRRTRASGPDDESAIERYFLAALTLAVVGAGFPQIAILSLDIWYTLGDRPAPEALELGRRIVGLTMSGVFVFMGNAMPKILTPLAMLPPPLAQRVTSARRFVGRIFVLLGLAVAVASVALPIAIGRLVMVGGTACIVASTLGAIVWMNAGAVGREP